MDSAMTVFQVLYWHDIPIQVRAGSRGNRASVELPPRFQEAIDNAAMAAGLTGTDGYLSAFVWGDQQERDGSPDQVAAAVAHDLSARYAEIDWRKTAAAIKRGAADA